MDSFFLQSVEILQPSPEEMEQLWQVAETTVAANKGRKGAIQLDAEQYIDFLQTNFYKPHCMIFPLEQSFTGLKQLDEGERLKWNREMAFFEADQAALEFVIGYLVYIFDALQHLEQPFNTPEAASDLSATTTQMLFIGDFHFAAGELLAAKVGYIGFEKYRYLRQVVLALKNLGKTITIWDQQHGLMPNNILELGEKFMASGKKFPELDPTDDSEKT